MPNALPERRPWPMKWIVLAIILFIGGYTYLTLHYRKPGRDYRPYEDMKNRANTLRLLEAGYQRIQLPVQRPADATGIRDTAFPAPGGLPAELQKTIVSLPLLPAEIVAAQAPATAAHDQPYRILFRCVVPDDKQTLAGAELYVHGDTVVITPDFELLAAGLEARSRETLVVLTIPPETLKPADYRITLAGQRASRAWRLQLK